MSDDFLVSTPSLHNNVVSYLIDNAPVNFNILLSSMGILYTEIDSLTDNAYLIHKEGAISQYELVINSSLSDSFKRFLIARELGHYFMHKHLISRSINPFRISSLGTRRSNPLIKEEHMIYANRFACSILLPEKIVLEMIHKDWSISDIANHFKVSSVATKARVNQLKGLKNPLSLS